jgi:hypothetical protein
MGGRAASMAVAEGLAADGLILFSYPWHPPGKTDQPRTAHLGRIRPPVLCFTGTRDPFCDRKAISRVLASLPSHWSQVFIEGADHGLDFLKRDRRSRDDLLAEISADLRKWLAALARGQARSAQAADRSPVGAPGFPTAHHPRARPSAGSGPVPTAWISGCNRRRRNSRRYSRGFFRLS